MSGPKRVLIIVLILTCALVRVEFMAAQTPSGPPNPGDPWPKRAQLGGATYTIYQPQIDSWDSFNMAAHAAVSVLPPGSQTPMFGVLRLTAKTKVDRLARTVYFTDTTVQSAMFPASRRNGGTDHGSAQAVCRPGRASLQSRRPDPCRGAGQASGSEAASRVGLSEDRSR